MAIRFPRGSPWTRRERPMAGGHKFAGMNNVTMETNDMTSLTVREKEHWKERITRKIDQAIESLYSLEKPTFLEEIDNTARKKAVESLGLTEVKNRVEELEVQRQAIDREKSAAEPSISRYVPG